jgi:hypothetical protein
MFLVIFCLLFSWIKYHGKLLIFPTIQKPYGSYRQFYPDGYAASLKPPVFEGVNYKRWCSRTIIWLTTMRCFDASNGKPQRKLTPVEEKAFEEADNLMRGAIISVLGENIVDSYLSITTGKDMWDALEAKFGVSNAGSELYVMEQFFDYKMTDERDIVE